MEDKVSIAREWIPSDPSSETSASNLLFEGKLSPLLESSNQKTVTDPKEEEHGCGFQYSTSRSGLVERMSNISAFSTLKINTAEIREANMSSSHSSHARSPYLTIPPGFSPTTLLDSPIFISNMPQPSPTTGTFLFHDHDNSNPVKPIADQNDPESSSLKQTAESSCSYFTGNENNVSIQFKNLSEEVKKEVAVIPSINQEHLILESEFLGPFRRKNSSDDIFCPSTPDPLMSAEHSPRLGDQNYFDDDRKSVSSMGCCAPAEDGYHWRKYGQKQVKGGEYPRSYYKCSHPNCSVKKKVERSLDGDITEIVYKGTHNHPKSSSNCRPGISPSHLLGDLNPDDGSDPVNCPEGIAAECSASHNRMDGCQTSEMFDPSCSKRIQDGLSCESMDVVSLEDDQMTRGSASIATDEGEEIESKRRKMDTAVLEMNSASRMGREPRVVVQTVSEVDILDDGYRWRKYGQKVVKGNPNPRSYYKCTNPGCLVRKHVERASHDLKSVITTYEGKHNHDAPAARSSGHLNTAAPHPPCHLRRLELTPTQDIVPRFDSHCSLEMFGSPSSYAFGINQQGLLSFSTPRLSPEGVPMAIPAIPQVQTYLGHRLSTASEAESLIKREDTTKAHVSHSGLSPPDINHTMYAWCQSIRR